jgi:hypothetical protein
MSTDTVKHVLPGTVSMSAKTAKTSPQDGSSAIEQRMESLFATMLPLIDERKSLVVHLVAATRGEGVSTLARTLAVTAGQRSWCKVALLELVAEGATRGGERLTLLEQFAEDGTVNFEQLSVAGAPLSLGRLSDTGAARPRIDKLREFYAWARERFTLVIVDCPAIMKAPDSAVLCGLADETILVVEADRTRVPVVQRARETLASGGANILGVVLNKREDLIPSFLYRFI